MHAMRWAALSLRLTDCVSKQLRVQLCLMHVPFVLQRTA